MLETLISSKTRLNLLIRFFLNLAKKSHLRGIANDFSDSTNSIRLELNNLTEAGYLIKKKEHHLEFDIDQAGEENKNNPIYYIQYAHARITKILKNFDDESVSEENYDNLNSKNEIEIILTEKEIQLLELFLKNKKPISKNKILSSVWNYSSDADTHTVETHIYRLRKKINDKFSDENFIVNTKDGYSL